MIRCPDGWLIRSSAFVPYKSSRRGRSCQELSENGDAFSDSKLFVQRIGSLVGSREEIMILVETATRLWVSVSDGSGVLF
jgi:hypothetical protein